MYQRILIPVDGSPTADRALREAMRLATDKVNLRLVYVVDEVYPLDADSFANIDYESLQDAARQTGTRVLAAAASKMQGMGTVETGLLESHGERIASVIDKEAVSWKAELIVIGTHGRSGINRLLLGSVAEGVVRGTSVPVLLIRSE